MHRMRFIERNFISWCAAALPAHAESLHHFCNWFDDFLREMELIPTEKSSPLYVMRAIQREYGDEDSNETVLFIQ